jgi:hypothetical protein
VVLTAVDTGNRYVWALTKFMRSASTNRPGWDDIAVGLKGLSLPGNKVQSGGSTFGTLFSGPGATVSLIWDGGGKLDVGIIFPIDTFYSSNAEGIYWPKSEFFQTAWPIQVPTVAANLQLRITKSSGCYTDKNAISTQQIDASSYRAWLDSIYQNASIGPSKVVTRENMARVFDDKLVASLSNIRANDSEFVLDWDFTNTSVTSDLSIDKPAYLYALAFLDADGNYIRRPSDLNFSSEIGVSLGPVVIPPGQTKRFTTKVNAYMFKTDIAKVKYILCVFGSKNVYGYNGSKDVFVLLKAPFTTNMTGN